MSKKRNTQPKKRMSTETDDTQSSSTKKEKKLVEDEQGILVAKSKDGHETFTLFYGGTPYLSNFYMSPFTLDQNTFNCGEQYFHYKKAGQSTGYHDSSVYGLQSILVTLTACDLFSPPTRRANKKRWVGG
jgi:hypothetical protein